LNVRGLVIFMKYVLFVSSLVVSICISAQAQRSTDSLALAANIDKALTIYLSDPDAAIAITTETLALAREKKLPYIQGQCYFSLSKATWAKAHFRLSMEYGFNALRVFENSVYTHDWGLTLLAIGRDFVDLGELQQAKSMILSSLHLAYTTHDEELQADSYREYSLILYNLHEYDSVMSVAHKGIAYYERVGDISNIGILYTRISHVYDARKDYKQSMYYTEKSIEAYLASGNKRGLSFEYLHSAERYFQVNKLDSAKKFIQASLMFAEDINNIPLQIRCHILKEAIFESENKTAVALAEYKIISQLKDSLQLIEKSRQLAETLALSELETKEGVIQLLEKENDVEKQLVKSQRLVSYFLVVMVMLLLLLVFVLWRLRNNQTKAHELLSLKNTAIDQQRKEIQTQAENLQELNLVKLKLFSLISHDLRGPISNIQTLLSMLTQRLLTMEEFLSLSEKLKTELNNNQRTLENLLNWSLSQMDGIKTDQQAFNVGTIVDEVSQLMNGIATRKEITIENLEGCNCSVSGDYNQVHLILRNIIHNAIKFSPNQTRISISTHPVNGFCKVVIHDQGVGLSSSEIDTLLNPNDYYSKTGTHHEKGTGLGLLLCKEFIKRNGGTFDIISSPGQGTDVSFTLPLARP
jgi:two-component system sensor histidine kinase/response regulator